MRHDRDSTSGCPLGERPPDTTSTSLRRTSSTETAPAIHGSRRQHHLRPDANPPRSSDTERTPRETRQVCFHRTGLLRLPSAYLQGCCKTFRFSTPPATVQSTLETGRRKGRNIEREVSKKRVAKSACLTTRRQPFFVHLWRDDPTSPAPRAAR